MKKLISILLAVMLVVSVAAVAAGAVTYGPFDDSYTVTADTPYTEEAIAACGGDLDDTQTIYFQAPADWANEYNTFAGPDDDEPYMHVCAYWWSGIGSSWPNGQAVKWVGYQAHLVDKTYRIYSIQMPNSGSPVVVWNNGVNAGMDKTAAIFKFGRQTMDLNTQGCEPGETDTLPEGTPVWDEDEYEGSLDGCIAVMDYSVSETNSLTGFDNYGTKLYVYYGHGCFGEYAKTSENYVGQIENCKNPDHFDADGNHIEIEVDAERGDINGDTNIDIVDVNCLQRHLVKKDMPEGMTFHEEAADVDQDNYISIIDATRIQRFLAKMCDL